MLNDKFKEVMNSLDENITNKKDLVFIKSQVTELTMEYLDELDKIESVYKQKLELCDHRINTLEMEVQKIENEIFEDEIDDTDLEPIKCPYCNSKFFIEFDSSKKEIKCPDCNNIIELDWGNFEDDM